MPDNIFKNIRKDHILALVYAVVIMAGLFKVNNAEYVPAFSVTTGKKTVLIDAGHGGWDPGKVNESGIQEKEINLAISEKLQYMLEQGGSFVVTTRTEDVALANSKQRDLDARRDIATNYNADILISIHQNSYPSPGVRGSQVFYFDNSENSQRLAECIQSHLSTFLDPEYSRPAKANGNYYILKKTTVPAVIIECGFLTNYSETQKLLNDEYQEKIAWSIYMGIVDYFSEK